MFKHVINIGTKTGQSLSEQKRIKLLNQIVLVFVLTIFIKFVNEVFVADPIGMALTGGMISLFLCTLILQKKEWYVAARIFMTLMLTLSIVLLNLFYGRVFGSEFGYFPLLIMAIIFFEKLSFKLGWGLFFMSSYMGSTWYLQHNSPLFIENHDPSSFYFMFFACFSAVFVMSYVFIRQNENFEEQTNSLLATLESKNNHLENVNAELEKFAYVASHDLKTPLRNINSFLNLIQRKINKGQTDELEEYLEFAQINAKRMHGLVQDILEFSQLNNKQTSFENKDLYQLVDKALFNLTDVIKAKNVTVEVSDLPVIFCDDSQMISLFQNIIENGIKYNISSQPSIYIYSKEKELEHEIFVKDNGIGIEKEFQDKVFDMFYRLHNQDKYNGSGIGLAICQKVAVYHGGTIDINSIHGEGTTFIITLPKHSQDSSIKREKLAVLEG